MSAKRLLGITLAAPALLAVVYCGGSSDSTPPTTPTPAPTAGPTAPPPLGPLRCDPTPPPLYGFRMKVHQNSGNRKTIDATPLVFNVDGNTATYELIANSAYNPFRFVELERFSCPSRL